MTLIDRIYEAAVLPEKWPSVLDELGRIAGCDKSFIFTTDGRDVTGCLFNEGATELCTEFVQGNWMPRNPMGARTIQRREPKFTVDLDIFTPEERATEVFYRDFLTPHGAAWGTGSLVLSPGSDFIIYSLHREEALGPVEPERVQQLTELRPHLARAALLAVQMAFEQARSLVGTLADLGLPAATIGQKGQLHVANAHFEALMPQVVADFRTRLKFSSAEADEAYSAALGRALGNSAEMGSSSFPVPSGEGNPTPYIVHLVPIAGHGRDVFSSARWLMVALPVTIRTGLGPLILEGLFDLTPAEARVARGISEGQTLTTLAELNGVSVETVRSHLKGIFAKTGTYRQPELVALLTSANLPRQD